MAKDNTEPGTGWETDVEYLGGTKEIPGTKETENKIFKGLAEKTNEIQKFIKDNNKGDSVIRHGQHAKMHLGTDKAEFKVLDSIPEYLRLGFLQPGASYPAIVRLSNAQSVIQKDILPDILGLAFKVTPPAGRPHDFLLTNARVLHTSNAEEFVFTAEALAKNKNLLGAANDVEKEFNTKKAVKIFKTLISQTAIPVSSLATEEYWSRSATAFGPYALKYMVEPKVEELHGPLSGMIDKLKETISFDDLRDKFKEIINSGDLRDNIKELITSTENLIEKVKNQLKELDDYLRDDINERLKKGPVKFDVKIQLYKNKDETSIEDDTTEWKTDFETIGQLVIKKQDIDTKSALQKQEEINKMSFTPWNTNTDDFRPIGNINRSRKLVYEASAKLRNE